MNLRKILSQIKIDYQLKNQESFLGEIEIFDVAIDSRLIEKNKNTVFFALKGNKNNGENFVNQAIENGAKIIVSQNFYENEKIISIKTENVNKFLTEFLKIFYADLPKNIYCVTGTNGKSSVVEFSRQICDFLGKNSASIGTIGILTSKKIADNFISCNLTTFDIITLYKNLAILKKNEIDDVFIEASSIGLDQGRVSGLKIEVGAFTNFSQDHLDYHENMEKYFNAKMILFNEILSENGFAILNSDIDEFNKIKEICEKRNLQIIDYGFDAKTFKILEILQIGDKQEIIFEYKNKKYEIISKISSDFQAFNLICALAMVLSKNEIPEKNLKILLKQISNIKIACGRMEKVAEFNGAKIFIDFAHSPDALKNILENARKLSNKKLIVLFGCGGNRDEKKRPQMGKIACELADLAIITDDNPRDENPKKIRADILSGCTNLTKIIEIPERKEAIAKALKMLEEDDILILAGKGHEKYQIIQGQKIEFDEKEIVKNFILNSN